MRSSRCCASLLLAACGNLPSEPVGFTPEPLEPEVHAVAAAPPEPPQATAMRMSSRAPTHQVSYMVGSGSVTVDPYLMAYGSDVTDTDHGAHPADTDYGAHPTADTYHEVVPLNDTMDPIRDGIHEQVQQVDDLNQEIRLILDALRVEKGLPPLPPEPPPEPMTMGPEL